MLCPERDIRTWKLDRPTNVIVHAARIIHEDHVAHVVHIAVQQIHERGGGGVVSVRCIEHRSSVRVSQLELPGGELRIHVRDVDEEVTPHACCVLRKC
jgi:hypothetical protein